MDPVISSKTLSRCKCLIGVQLAIIAAAIFVLHREKVILLSAEQSSSLLLTSANSSFSRVIRRLVSGTASATTTTTTTESTTATEELEDEYFFDDDDDFSSSTTPEFTREEKAKLMLEKLYNEQGSGMPFSVNLTLAQEGLFRRLVHQHLMTCKRLGITTFLTKGSLLGYYRYGKPMPWDGDIDFCLTKADVAKYVKYFEKTFKKFHNSTLHVYPGETDFENDTTGHLKLCSAPKANVTAPLYGHQSNCSWPHIDLYYLRGSSCFGVEYGLKNMLPLRRSDFWEMTVPVVNKVENVLQSIYIYPLDLLETCSCVGFLVECEVLEDHFGLDRRKGGWAKRGIPIWGQMQRTTKSNKRTINDSTNGAKRKRAGWKHNI